ncbi:MAG: DUF2063 domain-containing protein [Candidatus Margulisbacteria bacterium]|nr:DUF2063 domain-containing protein [Candidatus Margulisiibacteriota bacterium]
MVSNPSPPVFLVQIQVDITASIVQKNLNATIHIKPSKTLTPAERLDIYADDYWARILDALIEDFPILQAYLGEDVLYKLAEEYLQSYRSQHFSLFYLGNRFPYFLRNRYHQKNKKTVLETVDYEWARAWCFFAPQLPLLDPSLFSKDDLMKIVLQFQPHVQLVSYKKQFRLIYRHDSKVQEKMIPRVFKDLLQQLQNGTSLDLAFDHISTALCTKEIEALFSFCIQYGLLCQKSEGEIS